MQHKLTNKFIKTLTPASKPYEVYDTILTGFLIRVQPSGVTSYYFRYHNQAGKHARYCIGKQSKLTVAQAREIGEQLAADVVQGRDVHHEKKIRKVSALHAHNNTLKAFIKRHYAPWVLANHKSGQDTLKRLAYAFGFLNDTPLARIDCLTLEKWHSDELARGKKQASINRDIAILKGLLSKAVAWKVLSGDPLKDFKQRPLDKKRRVRFLSEAEEERLRTYLKQRDATAIEGTGVPFFKDWLTPLVILALNTGLRRGELLNLTWDDIDFSQNLLTVEGRTTKTGQTRHLPLNREAVKVLHDWHSQQNSQGKLPAWVFTNDQGKRLYNVRYLWCQLIQGADIERFRFHDLRHHFASILVMNGVDLNMVRELLGHASMSMTLRYAHLAPKHKAKAVEALLIRQHNIT